MRNFTVFTDGGSRGNPGPAAIGVVISDQFNRQDLYRQGLDKREAKLPSGSLASKPVKREYGEYIGITTNNEAEYQAVIFALKKLKQLIGNEKASEAHIVFYVDSELLMKQLNHEYKVKEENIQKLFLEVHNLRLDFGKVEFRHVLRGKNTEADRLVNEVLDREANRLDL